MAGRRRSRKHSWLLRVSAVCFTAYAAYTLITMQLEVSAERRELEALSQSVVQQQAENEQMEHLLEFGEEKEFIEYMAREKLGYAYPDEKILIDRSAS